VALIAGLLVVETAQIVRVVEIEGFTNELVWHGQKGINLSPPTGTRMATGAGHTVIFVDDHHRVVLGLDVTYVVGFHRVAHLSAELRSLVPLVEREEPEEDQAQNDRDDEAVHEGPPRDPELPTALASNDCEYQDPESQSDQDEDRHPGDEIRHAGYLASAIL